MTVMQTLGLDIENPLTDAAAKKLIEIARVGVKDPARLKALTLQAFERQEHQPQMDRKRS
jgi:hypothetical protein